MHTIDKKVVGVFVRFRAASLDNTQFQYHPYFSGAMNAF
jgi:hypothetical protein